MNAKMKKVLAKAEQGDAQAQAEIAEFFMNEGVEKDEESKGKNYKQALDWAKKSVAQNCKEGCWILARAYECGRGTRKNRRKAVEIYEKGAELGHPACQHSLACYYLRGDFLEENIDKAEALLEKSYAQGYELGLLSLFDYYFYNGEIKKAIEILENAAQSGDVTAQYELAKAYSAKHVDDGKMLDASLSRYWYAKAALGGRYFAYCALNSEPMWENQTYEDDEELMSEIRKMYGSDEENYEDEDYGDDESGSLGFVPIVTNEKGEKHVDFFSLRLAGREDEYEELEAKLQEMLKNENE